jgi:hypothetical protein
MRLYGSGSTKESVFFFEKRTKKLFLTRLALAGKAEAGIIKNFLFLFFQKRSPPLTRARPTWAVTFFQKRRRFLMLSHPANFLLRIFHDLAAGPY